MKNYNRTIFDWYVDHFQIIYIMLFIFILMMSLGPIIPGFSRDNITFMLQIFNVFIIFYVTMRANKSSESIYSSQVKFSLLKIKPIITSSLRQSNKWSFKEINSWFITNSCEYAALNIIVSFKKGDNYSKYVLCNSIAGMQEQELFWVSNASIIEILYSDIMEEHFYRSTIINCSDNLVEIDAEEYSKAFEEASRSVNIATLYDKSVSGYEIFNSFIDDNVFVIKDPLIKS